VGARGGARPDKPSTFPAKVTFSFVFLCRWANDKTISVLLFRIFGVFRHEKTTDFAVLGIRFIHFYSFFRLCCVIEQSVSERIGLFRQLIYTFYRCICTFYG